MADVSDYISKLESLQVAVGVKETVERNCDPIMVEIEDEIPFSIPSHICRIFDNTNIINDLGDIFLGYNLLSKEKIASFYRERDKGSGFFGKYGVDKKFNVKKGMYIVLQENRDMELIEPVEVTNIAKYFPLFSFQGDYIVVNLDPSSVGELVVITYGHLGSILAPSVVEHLDDLVGGLKSGHYKVIDDDIIYPSSWYQRKKVRSGEFEMDDDGEILNQKGR